MSTTIPTLNFQATDPGSLPATAVLALQFSRGFIHYADLGALVGDHRAQIALQRCVDVCRSFDAQPFARAQTIAQSPYINPQGIESVDNIITGLLVEVLKTMHENHCFAADLPARSWEFVQIKPGKLYLKPPNMAAQLHHPLLTPNHIGNTGS